MERFLSRIARSLCTIGLLGVYLLTSGPAVSAQLPRPVGPPNAVIIDYANLLNGRYSFRLQGEQGFISPVPLSAIGSIVFDGQGNVLSAKLFLTTNGATQRLGRSGDQLEFVHGTYTVNNTEIGHIDLHFDFIGEGSSGRTLSLDIALTNGGKSFFINVHSMIITNPPSDPSNLEWTVNGQATQE